MRTMQKITHIFSISLVLISLQYNTLHAMEQNTIEKKVTGDVTCYTGKISNKPETHIAFYYTTNKEFKSRYIDTEGSVKYDAEPKKIFEELAKKYAEQQKQVLQKK